PEVVQRQQPVLEDAPAGRAVGIRHPGRLPPRPGPAGGRSGAGADLEAPVRPHRQAVDLLGPQGERPVAGEQIGDDRTDPQRRRPGGETGQHRPRLEVERLGRLAVVEGGEAEVLGRPGGLDEPAVVVAPHLEGQPHYRTIRFRRTPMRSISSSTTSPGESERPSSSPQPVPTVPEPRISPGWSVSDRLTKAMTSSKRWCMAPLWPRLHSSPLTRAVIVRS